MEGSLLQLSRTWPSDRRGGRGRPNGRRRVFRAEEGDQEEEEVGNRRRKGGTRGKGGRRDPGTGGNNGKTSFVVAR